MAGFVRSLSGFSVLTRSSGSYTDGRRLLFPSHSGFPRVETVDTDLGTVVTRADVEAIGVVAPQEKTNRAAIRFSRCRPDARGWLSYPRCVANAPPARGGGRPDISQAYFTFCRLTID